ncbi:HD domain-containing protein [Chitinophaga oryziterrae]|uniref:HD domain-containing protein n=1 Tax=Chitinophaga oryziterrae TaxID=1031224 RepID=A0A6N8JGV0_9BACT|nr:HD domain-containing protein [Chitinophaga oryziterrae]MVT43382.1 HD domain-containing protein [Chitinophaga oryziterrae]
MDLVFTESLVREYVTDLFARLTSPYLIYHNLTHTEEVVIHAKEITKYYELDERTDFIISVAAWFHDTGHLVAEMEVHEEAGVDIMGSFLEKEHINDDLIAPIAECIMATRYPPTPKSRMEEIICDADTYHFGTKYLEITDDLVRREMELRENKQFPHWYENTIQLLKDHRFFTSYCRNKLDAGKAQNIRYLEEKIKSR